MDKIRKVIFLSRLAKFLLNLWVSHTSLPLRLQCHFNWHLVIKKEETKLAFLRTVSSMYFFGSFRMLLREMSGVLLWPSPSPRAHPHLYTWNRSILMMVFEKTNFLYALN